MVDSTVNTRMERNKKIHWILSQDCVDVLTFIFDESEALIKI